MLNLMIRGYCSYYGITGNGPALNTFRMGVMRAWRAWLSRRGGKKGMPWERMLLLLQRYPLAPARVVHSVLPRSAKL